MKPFASVLILALVGAVSGRLPSDSICSLNPDSGPCQFYSTRYYYEPSNDRCKMFLFGGCGGNANAFVNESVCLKTCSISQGDENNNFVLGEIPNNENRQQQFQPDPVCQQPVFSGCFSIWNYRYTIKFHFDMMTGTCKSIRYCGGGAFFGFGSSIGGNLFNSEDECLTKCTPLSQPVTHLPIFEQPTPTPSLATPGPWWQPRTPERWLLYDWATRPTTPAPTTAVPVRRTPLDKYRRLTYTCYGEAIDHFVTKSEEQCAELCERFRTEHCNAFSISSTGICSLRQSCQMISLDGGPENFDDGYYYHAGFWLPPPSKELSWMRASDE